MKELNIAVQKKGRMYDDCIGLLKKCGFSIRNSRDQLKVKVKNFDANLLFLRNSDIPKYVANGVADIGFLGQNTIKEKAPDLKTILDLGFQKCRLSLAVPKENDWYNGLHSLNGRKIATSYPNSLKAFLDENGVNAEIDVIQGSVEIAPNIGLADAICDLVESGSTLFKNGLVEKDVMLFSEATIAVNDRALVGKKALIDELIFRIQSVQRAESHRYILMNVPNDKIQQVSEILPVLKSPTVLPLVEEGWSSLHSVISENDFWSVISELKQLGAEGIIVTPIEKNGNVMKVIVQPNDSQLAECLIRPSIDTDQLEGIIGKVFDEVGENGDRALMSYAEQFDKVILKSLAVSDDEIKKAEQQLSEELKSAIKTAYANIKKFHESQVIEDLKVVTVDGVECWQKASAIESVGLYIPGGTAPLFSTVLMLGIPASIAGCENVVLCSPPQKNGEIHPATIYAADLCGIQKIFRSGGSQAIAAMTIGTESIPKVHKLFGPGNQYVTAAKQKAQKYGVAIDLPAGPSEVLVYADDSAVPSFVAADLLSQAEHGVDSQVVLVSSSEHIAIQSIEAVKTQTLSLPRKEVVMKCLENSVALVIQDADEAFDFINDYAPEHFIIASDNSESYIPKIKNAGSVFLGNYSPESAGDYASGTNHTLPTSGYAKSYSGTNLDAFVKKITFQKLTKKGIQNLGNTIMTMAREEQLEAHARAVEIRLKELQ